MGTSSSKNNTELVKSSDIVKEKNLFPKNVIIIIGTHGEILDEEFDIEPEISVYKFNLAPVGLSAVVSGANSDQIPNSLKPEDSACFLSGSNDISRWSQIIENTRKNIKYNIDTTKDPHEIQTFMTNVQEKIKPLYSENITKKRSRFEPVVQQLSKSCQVSSCKTKMANKVYFIDKANNSPDPRNWGITAINSLYPYFDILKAIAGYKRQVTTQEIIEYLKKNGVENVLLFDFSCATYFDQDERTERRIKRGNTSKSYGGAKKRKKINKKSKKINKKSKKINKKSKKINKKSKNFGSTFTTPVPLV